MIWLKILIFSVFVVNQLVTSADLVRAPLLVQPLVVGGWDTPIDLYPYMCSVRRLGNHSCGATIVNSQTLLTAAHCVRGRKTAPHTVQCGVSTLGTSSGTIVQATEFVIHPGFDIDTYDNDVALIRVAPPIAYNSKVQPGILADQEPNPNKLAYVMGWGRLSEDGERATELQSVDVTIIDRDECNWLYTGEDWDYALPVTERMICAGHLQGGKDACQGDSGGPLIVDGKQVGIVSWGNGCARKLYPGVYANVPALKTWIQSNL